MRGAAAILFLALSGAAHASAAAAGHGGIPWGDVVKQAINFAILAGVLAYLLRKPLAAYLKERTESLKKAIDDAARARAEAAEKLASAEAQAARLAADVAEIARRAEAEAEAEAKRMRDAADAEIARIRQQAKFTAEQEVRKAREELRREAAELSARSAAEIVARAMTPEDQERLVRENIEKIREIVR